jgi:recombination protein RecA
MKKKVNKGESVVVNKPNINQSPKDKVAEARSNILAKFGANSVRLGEDLLATNYGRIPTGSLALDFRLGGGIPIGRAVHIAGDFSTGKSTLSDHIAKEAQHMCIEYDWIRRYVDKGREQTEKLTEVVEGLTVGYIDIEGTKDTDWASGIGVDVANILYATPEGQEEAMDLAFAMQQNGVNLVILDSVDSMIPIKEYEKEDSTETNQMGNKQKLNGVMMRKFTNFNNKLVREGKVPCTFIILNQLRSKIGFNLGDPNFTTGGRAIDFYSSIIIYLRSGDKIQVGKGKALKEIGKEIRFKVHKNKTHIPNQTDSFDLYFEDAYNIEKGHIDNVKSLILLAIEFDVIERAGAFFKYDGVTLAQGQDKLMDYLKDHEDTYESIKAEVFEYMSDATGSDDEDEE